MKAISYTAARNNFSQTMQRVCEDHDPIIITRKSADSVVMLSLDDYEALQETSYLLQNPANAKRLIASIEQLESGKGSEKGMLE